MGQKIQNLVTSLKQLLLVPPVFIDGGLIVAMALFGAFSSVFANDEAGKWMDGQTLWVCRSICDVLTSTTIALIGFRSKAMAEHLSSRKSPTTGGQTEFIQKTP